jgi:hypothetical protein
MWKISGNRLTLENGQWVDFSATIMKCAMLQGVLVVLLEPPKDVIMNENAYGVTANGGILWQIENIGVTDPVGFYVGILREVPGRVFLANYSGFAAKVDLQTGKILATEFTK